MIVFRRKWYSMLWKSNTMVQKITNKLDKEKIYDYEVSERIPKDSISINTSLDSLEIYIPKDQDFAQYGIDTRIRELSPSLRTSISFDRDIYIMKVKSSITYDQYYQIIKYIIEEEGFCVIITKD